MKSVHILVMKNVYRNSKAQLKSIYFAPKYQISNAQVLNIYPWKIHESKKFCRTNENEVYTYRWGPAVCGPPQI